MIYCHNYYFFRLRLPRSGGWHRNVILRLAKNYGYNQDLHSYCMCIPIHSRLVHYSIPFPSINSVINVFTLKIPKRKSAL